MRTLQLWVNGGRCSCCWTRTMMIGHRRPIGVQRMTNQFHYDEHSLYNLSTFATKSEECTKEQEVKIEQEVINALKNGEFIAAGSVPIPSPGSSSGDPEFDQSVKLWRSFNTEDDPALQKLYKKKDKIAPNNAAAKVLQTANSLIESDDEEDVSIEAELEEDEVKEFVNPYNPETGEYNGPTGPEPTRYGDWERKGRVSDF
jgi:hypothetical protein